MIPVTTFAGKKVAVFRYRIVARNTIEQTAVIPRLKSKASVQDALKAAMKISHQNPLHSF